MNYEKDHHAWLMHRIVLLREAAGEEANHDPMVINAEKEHAACIIDLTDMTYRLVMDMGEYATDAPRKRQRRQVNTLRQQLSHLLKKSPSLEQYCRCFISVYYEDYCDRKILPRTCPWSLENILDETFFPSVNPDVSDKIQGDNK